MEVPISHSAVALAAAASLLVSACGATLSLGARTETARHSGCRPGRGGDRRLRRAAGDRQAAGHARPAQRGARLAGPRCRSGRRRHRPPFVSLLSASVAREWEALRVPVSRRGRLTDERLFVMRALWTDDSASFAGNLVSFADVELFPKPLAAGRHPDPRGRQLPRSTRPDRPRRIHVAAQSCERRRSRRRHRPPAAASHCSRHGVLGEVGLDLYMRLDDTVSAAESAVPRC